MTLSRAEALEALVTGTAAGGSAPDPRPRVERSGVEVYAGGDVKRLLISKATLAYRDGDVLVYPKARPGDVVLLTAANARRLDEAAVTVDPDADADELEEQLNGSGVTDAQLEAMTAPDLIAFVGQNPDERDRVRNLELGRAKQRATVLKATEPTPEADAEAAAEAAAKGTPGVDGATEDDGTIPE